MSTFSKEIKLSFLVESNYNETKVIVILIVFLFSGCGDLVCRRGAVEGGCIQLCKKMPCNIFVFIKREWKTVRPPNFTQL